MPQLPPLKSDPKYGHFPWWPEDGDGWIHPDDVAAVRALVPSARVFRREGNSGEFVLMHYGDASVRVRPTLWQEVAPEGFEIGDWVEVRSRGLANEPRTGTIAEMLWDNHAEAICYQIVDDGRLIETRYSRDDLKHVDPTERLST
jgi:hypothetical protein